MFGFRNKRRPDNASSQPKPTAPLAEEQSIAARFDYQVSALSDVGCVRESNEDNVRHTMPHDPDTLARQGILVMVADGMGGHACGEIASGIAVETISRVYYEKAAEPGQALRHAFEEANRAIHNAARKDQSKKGMGTTCTALALRGGMAFSAHVGDSRLYLMRGGDIYLMSEDHSAVREMVRQGLITGEAARNHPQKNVITRALGTQLRVEVDVYEPFPVQADDCFLLCSDGLYDLVEDAEIKRVVLADDLAAACKSLIELAKNRGGHDNVTVAIVAVKPLATEPSAQSESVEIPATRELEIV
jgi:PPM family protein phosphatase